MADFDNLAEISENFDTIKTLLNSIRAQGILNTSDVDKLLSGINTKLEKINTEEDIDLIKIFLSELKQSLDERHNLMLSKFGAIESLFANLLKTSSESLKSSEIKELFDIVATNLSVFSREVVSQKESLTDISLRLDAIRSDDTQKKDILKNITILKSDIERLNNGFDSIVINLNENFKTLVKTITSLDKTEYFDKFSDAISGIEMSSNTVLSALQMLDKKAEQVEVALGNVATKDEMSGAAQKIFELTAQSQELTSVVSSLNDKYGKFDNLAEKIDASVNIIAGLKSVLEDTDNVHTQKILAELATLQDALLNLSTDSKADELKIKLENIFKYLQERSDSLGSRAILIFEEVQKLVSHIQALDINSNFEGLKISLNETVNTLRFDFDKKIQNLTDLNDANINKVLNDISLNADSLGAKLSHAQNEIGILCEKNFSSVFENIKEIKTLISQVDENSISANNAIFSSITDRLSIFETGLKDSLDIQEKTVLHSSAQLVEQIENIKNVANVLDYKLDASVVEAANVKQEFAGLKTSVENVLALDFTNIVKDLRVDLYAAKQEMTNSFDNSSNDLSEKFTTDLYSKYELLVSKIDSAEDALTRAQFTSLASLKSILDNISGSIMDVISYVSEKRTVNGEFDSTKIDEIINLISDTNINYVESVRDIVDVIRVQVEANIKSIEEENASNFESIRRSISDNSNSLKTEIKSFLPKLAELQDANKELQEILSLATEKEFAKFTELLASTDEIKSDVNIKIETLKKSILEKIADFKTEFTCENADKINEIRVSVDSFYDKNSADLRAFLKEMQESFSKLSADEISGRVSALSKIADEFANLKDLLYTLQDKDSELISDKISIVLEDFSSLKSLVNTYKTQSEALLDEKFLAVINDIEALKTTTISSQVKTSDLLSEKIASVSVDLSKLKEIVNLHQEKLNSILAEKIASVLADFNDVKELLNSHQATSSKLVSDKIASVLLSLEKNKELYLLNQNKTESIIQEKNASVLRNLDDLKNTILLSQNKTEAVLNEGVKSVSADISDLRADVNSNENKIEEFIADKTEYILKDFSEIKNTLAVNKDDVSELISNKVSLVLSDFSEIKSIINKVDENIDGDMSRQLSLIEANFESLVSQITILFDKSELGIIDRIKTEFDKISEEMQATVDNKLDSYKDKIETVFEDLKNKNIEQSDYIQERIANLNSTLKNIWEEQSEDNIKQIAQLSDSLVASLENNSENVNNEIEQLKEKLADLLENVEATNNALVSLENSNENKQREIEKLSDNITKLAQEQEDASKANFAEFESKLDLLSENINSEISSKIDDLKESSSKHLVSDIQVINDTISNILEEYNTQKSYISTIKTQLEETLKSELQIISTNVEKETDIIISELIEQFDLLKKSQNDDVINISSRVEEIVNAHIYNSVEDLKSYLDIKTDDSVLNSKLDNIKIEISDSFSNVITNLSKMLDNNTFVSAMSDFKLANEIVLNTAVDNLNDKFEDFINANFTDIIDNNKVINDKLTLIDKKVVDLITEKFEEIKMFSTNCNQSFETTQSSIGQIFEEFSLVKQNIANKIDSLSEIVKNSTSATNTAISKLNDSFESLKNQILNRDLDEEFQSSVNKQINELKQLVNNQFNHIEDISDLCANNLPDLADISVYLKHSVMESLKSIADKLDDKSSAENFENELKQLKSDIITQFINVFNQLSFVVEQEEIIDFVQEKHDELITILSHIVTTNENIDYKVDSIREEIDLINEKISSIISSEGDVDYVYSLHDLESDIANLRLVLNEMKDKGGNFDELIASTEDIYKLVDSIKTELPNRQDFNAMAEDLVSISTRTNKLILASDESYKNLQDNLQDFKLVINDLDERTRNFARESGLDRIDTKLNALNNMVQSGAKTNQVFNQVFEYLAEWVDNASTQINSISDKVETLDDIGQIKAMLLDLKENNEDSSETVELIEALGTVFDKQTKRISALETKLDKIIVETTINGKNNKIDLTPFESTLNKFLVAIDERMGEQQEKISSLETKLSELTNSFEENQTQQLTKKVGGMDRQIAKLNKSIEKIASHVIEK